MTIRDQIKNRSFVQHTGAEGFEPTGPVWEEDGFELKLVTDHPIWKGYLLYKDENKWAVLKSIYE